MHPFFDLPRPHLFGHRGASGECPENTQAAFERAVTQGVPYLETDCHATADGEIALFHDADLERTTDGSGPIRALSWSELQRLDAGYRFTSDGGASFPWRGKGVRVPRLVEVLRAFPDIRLNIEIKQADPPIAAEVLRLIRESDAERRVLLAAEDDAIMDSIHALEPGTAIGSSTADAIAFGRALLEERSAEHRPRGHALQIPPELMGEPIVTRKSVDAAHAIGLVVHVWTINEPAEMLRLLELGVDGLMSDHPARLVQAAARRGA